MPQNNAKTRVAGLNDRYRLDAATAVLRHALTDAQAGQLALVSSFGAESVVLLHMVSVIDRTTPVIFLDTELLFAETLVYQQEVSERLGLCDVRIIHADRQDVARTDPEQTLHRHDTDACCDLRKTRPLARALDGFDGWITGRKRYHGGSRASLDFFETEDGTVVILTELPDNPGMSVTNASEELATAITQRYRLAPARTVWIEHHWASEHREADTYDAITYTWHGRTASHPRWRPIPVSEVYDLCSQKPLRQ